MENKLTISSSPHIVSNTTTSHIMRDVIIALIPATLGALYFFRMGAVVVIVPAILAAVAAEAIFQKMSGRKVTVGDLSAVVTGLLLALHLPPNAPWWLTVVGSLFAIIVVKQLFGGIGHNFMNPALAARAVLLASWPVQMTSWVNPGADAVSSATPLGILSEQGKEAAMAAASLKDLFMGNVGGCVGETSVVLLLIGGAYLLYRGVITYIIPAYYMGTVAILTLLLGGFDFSYMLFHLFAGGLVIGAVFMATDYSTSPVTQKGQIVYAVGCGVLTTVIRLYGGYPEGVSYSIILMNVATPLIERYTTPKVFGEVAK
ncbi:electron transport complex protein RnfD [Peptoclostridium acidaminophilum DSM 3953]|uniref:Ion-translocating oxidoreductase complex subunit D n=1 Tax=Peptoclostridium acidaminophilum DSM 3953 TaxID=1286171 RepID=W8T3U4_PEPAC|nr:RnfABCDGE type electron transport complex subunit D [Peptoclostridium acidaminophilum]AHM56439.1 electron transport complex protein RnfD [Peptoclostridium acidaminophilum DSM 3953]